MLKLTNIRIENGSQGVVTDSRRPRFSFALSSDKNGSALERYRITVRSGAGMVWDSGDCVDKKQVAVRYNGQPLQPFTEYSVTVTASDNFGDQAKGETGFSTGRLDLPWQAKWITDVSLPVPEKSSPVPLLFRREIRLKSKPVKARICATALGIYEITVNGKKLGDR